MTATEPHAAAADTAVTPVPRKSGTSPGPGRGGPRLGAYARGLDDLWAAHTAPRAPGATTVAGTFTGCGGSSLGLSGAGWDELLAVEWNTEAAAVFAANFPDVPLHVGDIWDVDPAVLGLAPGELDVHAGSPPCQTFSTMRRRTKGGRAGALQTDPRTELWRANIRLTEAWMPRVVVIENVAGMARGVMKPIFGRILEAHRKIGYRVHARLIDASWLGVPQVRLRVIIIGVRDDLGIDPATAFPDPFAPRPTLRQAWEGLAGPGPYVMPGGKIAPLVPMIKAGEGAATTLRHRGGGNHHFGLKREHLDRPARTVVAMASANYAGLIHPRENRFFGTAELARVQSFPDQFDWLYGDLAAAVEGTTKAGRVIQAHEKLYERTHRLIGNSVPPVMMYHIGRAIEARVLDVARGA